MSEHRSGAEARSSINPVSADHVVLVGMMGSGKTRVGRQLATRLGVGFVDSDEQIERRYGRTVREIFEADGEPAFRKLEAEALAEAVGSTERSVIAAAGGVVLDAVTVSCCGGRARSCGCAPEPRGAGDAGAWRRPPATPRR